MDKTWAGVIEKPRQYTIHSIPVPQPKDNEVLIRLEGCGVCASNLAIWEGAPWFEYPREAGSPGHEGWGVVQAVGSNVTTVQPGDRVAALTYHAFATHDLAAADAVVKLPPALANTPFPGEPLACAMNIFERAGIQSGQQVAVVGVGFLGALLVQLAKQAGATTMALSRRAFALETAREMGADQVFTYDDAVPHESCDVVIEATGKQQPLDIAANLTKVRGRLIVAGYHQDGPRTVNMQMWNWRGIDVINAHERDPEVYKTGIHKAVEAVTENRLNPSKLYTHCVSLSELPQAFDLMQSRPDGFVKALVLL